MRILVAGGGIGGLTLAVALEQAGLQCRILERDTEEDARAQGYAMSLRNDLALRTLRQLGLFDTLLQRVGDPLTVLSLMAASGATLARLEAAPTSPGWAIGVSRAVLRSVLRGAISRSPLEFGARVVGYEEGPTGCQVRLADGRVEEADLLVACDGHRSAIRTQLVGDAPRPLGLTMIATEGAPALDHPLLAKGAILTVGRGCSFFAQRYPGRENLVWSFCAHTAAGALDGLDPDALLARVREQVSGWHSPIPELVAGTPAASLAVRAFFDREPPAQVATRQVILIGDAAHSMSPFQGLGANLAMVDALELARALAAAGGVEGIPAALQRFGAQVIRRGRGAVRQSRMAARLLHARSAPAALARNGLIRVLGKLGA